MSKEELKTLKDIRCPLIAEAKENRFVETEKLEDMQKYLDKTWVAKAEIKKEAIRCAKAIKGIYKKGGTLFKKHGELAKGLELDLFEYEQDDCAGALKFIQWFFDITSEELS